MDKHRKGRLGEDIAKEHLVRQGFNILEHGFRCKLGEVDLVAEKGKELYFIEVKTRWSSNYGNPLESITFVKQRQVIKAARFYLAKKRRPDTFCHLSAIGVDMSRAKPKVEFIKDAFEI